MLTAISFKAVIHWSRPVLASKFSGLIFTTGEGRLENPQDEKEIDLTGHNVHNPGYSTPISVGDREWV